MPRRNERGSAATELVLVAPVIVVLLVFVAVGGRMVAARGRLDGAARDGARAASVARDASAARADARRAALASLGVVPCQRVEVAVDVADHRPGGTVAVRVDCALRLGDLALVRVPATRTVAARGVAVVNVYRGGA